MYKTCVHKTPFASLFGAQNRPRKAFFSIFVKIKRMGVYMTDRAGSLFDSWVFESINKECRHLVEMRLTPSKVYVKYAIKSNETEMVSIGTAFGALKIEVLPCMNALIKVI